jgi:ribonuclease HII
MLKPALTDDLVEAGCDEAGRGCLAGPVYAAAVILPKDYRDPLLNDSKKLTARQRQELRAVIEREALSWAVASVDNQVIDQVNILNASILAMHKALDNLSLKPQLILVDGNRFHSYRNLPHRCIIKGDATYMSIAAASVLAKTYRDDFMTEKSSEFPHYGWKSNKGYPTLAHRMSIHEFGISPYHRLSFKHEADTDLFSVVY